MRYEQLGNQGADAQNAVKFLPKGLVSNVIKQRGNSGELPADAIVKLKSPIVEMTDQQLLPRDISYGNYGDAPLAENAIVTLKHGVKDITDQKILPRDLTYGQVDVSSAGDSLTRASEEKKNEKIALGVGTLSILLLVYILFFR